MKRTLMVALSLVAASLATSSPAPAAFIPHTPAPPGQIYVVSVNAFQNQVLGVQRFEKLLELSYALLRRPLAFDGGSSGFGSAPDVIVVEEIRPGNLEILEKLIRQRSDFDYNIVGSLDSNAKFIINSDRVTMQGSEHVWTDVCYENLPPNPDGTEARTRKYQWAEFVQTGSNAPFAVAGIHFDKDYMVETGQDMCLERNVTETRRQLEATTAQTIITGDFNRRAVNLQYECDPDEQSPPNSWYLALTAPAQGTVYNDTVRAWHRERAIPMTDEWTHEQRLPTAACDTTSRFRRTRIDYMFASGMEIGSAHADHPGWAGPEPGQRHPDNAKYSDHRFVAGRFKIAGPARPAPMTATPIAGGRIQLAWTAPEVPVAGWVLYRAIGPSEYSALTRLTPDILTFEDFATEHGTTYRYALAAVDDAGSQGLESLPVSATADGRGPRVSSRNPGRNGIDIDRGVDVIVRFDEAVAPDSVSANTINLYSKGRSVCGSTTQIRPRILSFDPCFRLAKKRKYRAAVYSVRDRLGNRGFYDDWTFTTTR